MILNQIKIIFLVAAILQHFGFWFILRGVNIWLYLLSHLKYLLNWSNPLSFVVQNHFKNHHRNLLIDLCYQFCHLHFELVPDQKIKMNHIFYELIPRNHGYLLPLNTSTHSIFMNLREELSGVNDFHKSINQPLNDFGHFYLIFR